MNVLEFEVDNQTLIRIDSQDVINKSRNVYKCIFHFEEDSEWINLNKFALFTDGWGNSRTQHLGNNSNTVSCLVPDMMLKGSYFKISVYAGDLITTNTISVGLIQSGYNRKYDNFHHGHHHKDIFVEIFDRLDNSVDSIFYDNNTLHLFNRDRLLESLYLPFMDEDGIRDLVSDLTAEFIIPKASSESDGLMSKEDYIKLENIEPEANKTTIDSELSSESMNPVSNKTISDKFSEQSSIINSLDNHVNDIEENLEDSLEDIYNILDDKEDKYDYLERLDNIIVDLITKGKN